MLRYSDIVKIHLDDPVTNMESRVQSEQPELLYNDYEFRKKRVLVTGTSEAYEEWVDLIQDSGFMYQCDLEVKDVDRVTNMNEYDIIFMFFTFNKFSLLKVKQKLQNVKDVLVVLCEFESEDNEFEDESNELLNELNQDYEVCFVTPENAFEPITYVQYVIGEELYSSDSDDVYTSEEDE